MATQPKRSELLEAALRYADLGYPVFPCIVGTKKPATEHGFLDATTDADQIEQWWQKEPYNIGIPTAGCCVVDVDPAGQPWGQENIDILLTAGSVSQTPRGGNHYWFRQNGEAMRNTEGEISKGVDTRADGGYACVPPSVMNGNRYIWAIELEPKDRLTVVPDAIVKQLRKKTKSRVELEPAKPFQQGARNASLTKMAGYVRRCGASAAIIDAALQATNIERCNPPLDRDEVSAIAQSVGKYSPDEATAAAIDGAHAEPIEFERITCAQLDSGNYETEYLIKHTLVAGQPCIIAGGKKTLKTSIAIDMAIALAVGGYFLGKLPVTRAVRVGVMSGESGLGTLQETARRIAKKAGRHLADIFGLIWSTSIPMLSRFDHLDALERFATDDELEVLFLDPTYLMMPGSDAGNLFIQGDLLRGVSELCRRIGVTLVLLHHNKRHTGRVVYDVPELEDIAWAGFQEFARQWLLLGRRERYEPGTGEHRLWLNVGGSAGHSALWGLDIHEGVYDADKPRGWHVELKKADEVRQDLDERGEEKKERQAAERIDRDKSKIAGIMAAQFPDGETKTQIRDFAGLSGTRFNLAFAAMLADGEVKPCKVKKRNRKQPHEGFKLSDENCPD